MMTAENPKQITINLSYNADGDLDSSGLIHQLEIQLGGRIKITDWIDERHMLLDYPNLAREEARAAIQQIASGEYDEAIERDIRRSVLDTAVIDAGFTIGEDRTNDF